MLSGIASVYGRIADLRNLLYDRGVFQSFDLGARTISIGNLTTGGTGKTPLVAYLAKILLDRGEIVCILTRGYGRHDPNRRVLVADGHGVRASVADSGDEPFELARKLGGRSIIIADKDRVSAGEWAKRKFGVTTFILDDGFQHRRVRRDLDIVCIDATSPFGGGAMLPAGRLREPISNIRRADIVVITRVNLVSESDISNSKSEISNFKSEFSDSISQSMFECRNEIVGIAPLKEFLADSGESDGPTRVGEAFAFCGIGNPASFIDQLGRDGIEVRGSRAFRDHHGYTQQDVTGVEVEAARAGAQILITTAKDAVKLAELEFTIPCYVAQIETRIDDPEGFAALI